MDQHIWTSIIFVQYSSILRTLSLLNAPLYSPASLLGFAVKNYTLKVKTVELQIEQLNNEPKLNLKLSRLEVQIIIQIYFGQS